MAGRLFSGYPMQNRLIASTAGQPSSSGVQSLSLSQRQATSVPNVISTASDGQSRVVQLNLSKGGIVLTPENYNKLISLLKQQHNVQNSSAASLTPSFPPALAVGTCAGMAAAATSSTSVAPFMASQMPFKGATGSAAPYVVETLPVTTLTVSGEASCQPSFVSSATTGMSRTVIPLPDGRFIQRGSDGELSLLQKDSTTGNLKLVGKLSPEILKKENLTRILAASASIAVTSTKTLSSPSVTYSIAQSNETFVAGGDQQLPSLSAPPQQYSLANKPTNAAIDCFNSYQTSSDVSNVMSQTGAAKPICSVAPLLSQSSVRMFAPYGSSTSSFSTSSQAQTFSSSTNFISVGTSGSGSNTVTTSQKLPISGSTVLIQSPQLLLLDSNSAGSVPSSGMATYIISGAPVGQQVHILLLNYRRIAVIFVLWPPN